MEPECQAVAGCAFGVCVDRTSLRRCTLRSIAECNIRGCYLREGLCEGIADECGSNDGPATCAGQDCSWLIRGGSCMGTATPCESLDSTTCASQPGCFAAALDGGVDSGPSGTTVSFTTPVEGAVVSAEVEVSLSVDGASPDRIELLANGAPLVNLTEPYSYRWVTEVPEGTAVLSAQALTADAVVATAMVRVTVDRTAPVVRERPIDGTAFRPMRYVVSEPLDPSTVGVDTVALLVDGTSHPVDVVLRNGDTTTIDVTPTTPLPTLPTVGTLTILSGIADIAGNPLAPEATDVTFEPWVEVADLPFLSSGYSVYGANSVSSGAILVAYRRPTDVRTWVATWTGTAWSVYPSLWISRQSSHTEFRLARGRGFIAAMDRSEGVYLTGFFDGNWVGIDPAPPSISSRVGFDIETDGTDVVLARRGERAGMTGIFVDRLSVARGAVGEWTETYVPTAAGSGVDLIIDDGGDFVVWGDSDGTCHQARSTSGSSWSIGPVLSSPGCPRVVGTSSDDGTVFVGGPGFLFQEGAGPFLEATGLTPHMPRIFGTASSWFGVVPGASLTLYDGDDTPVYVDGVPSNARVVSLDDAPAVIGGAPPTLWRVNRP